MLAETASSLRRASVRSSKLVKLMSTAANVAPATATPATSAPGSLFIWGKIDDARMGMKVDVHNASTLTQVAMGPEVGPTLHTHISGVVQIACKAAKTLAVTKDGSVYSWGTCDNMSLGHGPGVRVVHRPKKIEALDGIRIVQVAVGETSSACVSEEGDVYTWGWGGSFWQGNGGLGHGDNTSQPRPALVQSLEEAGVRVLSVAVGNNHMVALTKEGSVLSWGNGEYGRCGNGKRQQLVPEPVELLAGKMVVAVAAGAQHTLALTADGRVYAWGKNDAGQLGLGGNMVMDLNTMEEYPLEVALEEDGSGAANAGDAKDFNGHVVGIAAGGNHSLAVTRSGRVYQFGGRVFLQPSPLDTAYIRSGGEGGEGGGGGSGSGKEREVPLRAVSVAAGEGASALVDASGHLYTWGKNLSTGMLGHRGYGLGTNLPVRVEALVGAHVGHVSLGSKHAAAVVGAPPHKAAPLR